MKPQDKARFAKLIAIMAETFAREVSASTHVGYWMGLSDLEYADLEIAVTKALRTCRFMPTVAELREFVAESRATPMHVFRADPSEQRKPTLWSHPSIWDSLGMGDDQNLGDDPNLPPKKETT